MIEGGAAHLEGFDNICNKGIMLCIFEHGSGGSTFLFGHGQGTASDTAILSGEF